MTLDTITLEHRPACRIVWVDDPLKIKEAQDMEAPIRNEDIYNGETISMKESLCAWLSFRGSHADAPMQYKKLLDYIKINKMQIVGFSLEITLIDYGITNDLEKFVTEICIPVI